jgi:hypothetical protein
LSLALQVKGVNDFHAARPHTWTRQNVTIDKGWVATSSNRRDYIFVQDDADMSPEGKDLYQRLNNLGAHAPAHDAHHMCLRTRDGRAHTRDGRARETACPAPRSGLF